MAEYSKNKAKELISQLTNGLSGKDLFNERDWYRVNRLLIYYTSDEEAIMFSVLTDVESRWDKSSKKSSFKQHLNGYFLFTVDYANKYLNKSPEQQRRALNKLQNRELISIKYWAHKKRTIKINWDKFTKQYVEWLKLYNNIEAKSKNKDPFDDMTENEERQNYLNSLDILNEDQDDYL